MRATFMGFETATRGIQANQKAIDVIGNNVSNIGVTGYTRQRVDLSSLSVNTRYSRYANRTTAFAGQGVVANGVSQIRDTFLDKRFREEYADVGYYDKLTEVLGDIENAMTEIEPSNITTALSQFKNAWAQMQVEGGQDEVTASTILAAARSLTQVFKQMDTKLNNVWEQQHFDLETNVGSVNSILQSIANLNAQIKTEIFTSYGVGNAYYKPNELYDARNVLLDQLSEYGNINVKENEDGTVTVTMGSDNHVVVEDDKFDALNVSAGKGGQTTSLTWQTTGKSADMSSGGLKASMQMLNGRGTAADATKGEDVEKGILYYMDKLDAFAVTLADAFNSSIEIMDADGNPTGTYKELFSFTDENGEKTAGGFTLSNSWADDPSYIMTNVHPKGEGADDTTFVSNIIALFTKTLDFGEYKGTFDGYVSYYTNANLANQKSTSQTRLDASTELSDSILKKISAISGVSMDEEGIDLTQYQKAYNAMSRVMTTLDEALDKLINDTGRVGR
ncbi:MAG: flagellar hook-associated protein FlgK [Oscillospiraceae bacterium]|nr:flagellar hook-associated protein FlgK [Oscillospiraceae bacterium]